MTFLSPKYAILQCQENSVCNCNLKNKIQIFSPVPKTDFYFLQFLQEQNNL